MARMRVFQILFSVLKSVTKVIITFLILWVVLHYAILRVTIVTRPDHTSTNESEPTVSLVTNLDVINILIWPKTNRDFDSLQTGQQVFIKRKCEYINCYVTNNRNMLGDEYSLFDAVLIDAKDATNLPKKRSPHQKYVFATRDLDIHRPVCERVFGNYFNLTFTPKLDSDAVWSYFPILIERKEINLPLENAKSINDTQFGKSHNSSKQYTAVFLRDCRVSPIRDSTSDLQRELKKFFLDIKILCADDCSKSEECIGDMHKYYFYLVVEEQLNLRAVVSATLKAFHYNTVPVIIGPTDYSRYLPRHSFINGWKFGPRKTAITMAKLIGNDAAYMAYFRWKLSPLYRPDMSSECRLCEILNRKGKKTYPWLKDWWNLAQSRCPDDWVAE